MNILQINTSVKSGSTGRIAEDIGKVLIQHNHKSYIAFGRSNKGSSSELIKVGGSWDMFNHVFHSLIYDRQGFGSKRATIELIGRIDEIKPDLIGLHNLHGYYLHVGVLFNYLKKNKIPVVWTFHDCWPFTGHCAHFDFVGCYKWQTHCQKCPLTRRYPKSIGFDNSFRNFDEKRELFTGHPNLVIVTPSKWLASLIPQSFLSAYPVKIIPNGVDLQVFIPLSNKTTIQEKIILGVASVWDRIKGLPSFVSLRQHLSNDYKIVLIGLSKKQIKKLPNGIVGLERTENIQELVQWYNRAMVFVNPTFVDTFPTTNIEALACGTPVVTYATGGSPEAIDENTGSVVKKGDVVGLVAAILELEKKNQSALSVACRQRAEKYFNKDARFLDYLRLYEGLDSSKIQAPVSPKK